MALAWLSYEGTDGGQRRFRFDIGVNRYYDYAIGAKETLRQGGFMILRDRYFESPMLGPLPETALGRVHPTLKTPVIATVLTVAVIITLALYFPLLTLAKATSFVILVIFTAMNVALIRLKLNGAIHQRGLWIPLIGACLSLALIGASLF